MKCNTKAVKTLANGRTLVRCDVCKKQRAFKSSDPAKVQMQCGVGEPIIGGPGTELKQIFSELGIKPSGGCKCKAYARQMGRWGVDGCRARHAAIVAHLQENAGMFGLAELAAAGWRALWQGKPWTLGGLVGLAIERAGEVVAQPAIANPGQKMILQAGQYSD